jgi:hypothetical protein
MILAWQVGRAWLDFYLGDADGISFADLLLHDHPR